MEREFLKWYQENEKHFAHSQMSDIEIAYSAWMAGKKQEKKERKALEDLTQMGE